MGEQLKVEGHTDLVRDINSQAIINTNNVAYNAAVSRSNLAQKQRDELRDATREINNIKCEMHEIKSLLQQLVGKE
jgi:hypothetical protein|tara:strand:+ start:1023 stop:1250 length:228 start_codon:yes stop_codon:yes gene_type:complete